MPFPNLHILQHLITPPYARTYKTMPPGHIDTPYSIFGRHPNRKLHPYALPAGALYSDSRRKPASPHKLKPVLLSTRFVTLSWELQDSPGLDTDGLTFSVIWSEVGSERSVAVSCGHTVFVVDTTITVYLRKFSRC